MIRTLFLSTALALLAALSPLHGQEELPLSIMEATSIGVGGYNLMDTYLTPGFHAAAQPEVVGGRWRTGLAGHDL